MLRSLSRVRFMIQRRDTHLDPFPLTEASALGHLQHFLGRFQHLALFIAPVASSPSELTDTVFVSMVSEVPGT